MDLLWNYRYSRTFRDIPYPYCIPRSTSAPSWAFKYIFSSFKELSSTDRPTHQLPIMKNHMFILKLIADISQTLLGADWIVNYVLREIRYKDKCVVIYHGSKRFFSLEDSIQQSLFISLSLSLFVYMYIYIYIYTYKYLSHKTY